jgi:hypothetical protein
MADLEALTDVLATSFHRQDGLTSLLYPLMRMALREDLRSRIRNRTAHYRCLVAVPRSPHPSVPSSLSPAILGTVEMSLRPQFFMPWYAWFQGVPYISNMAVAASHRRQGVASQLLAACEPIAQDWNCSSLYLHVLENNLAACRLYEKMGYVGSGDCSTSTPFNLPAFFLGQPRKILLRKKLSSPPSPPLMALFWRR